MSDLALPVGHVFADGAVAVDSHKTWNGWRALVYMEGKSPHPWNVCTAALEDEGYAWVRFGSEAWCDDRADAEAVFYRTAA